MFTSRLSDVRFGQAPKRTRRGQVADPGAFDHRRRAVPITLSSSASEGESVRAILHRQACAE